MSASIFPLTAIKKLHKVCAGIICCCAVYLQSCNQQVNTHDVIYNNGSVSLSARIYLPESEGPFPAIVIVPSAEPDTKEVFEEYAAYFAAHGIVTLCYDKRGAGNSTGDIFLAGFDDLLSDALAGVSQLKSLPQVDTNKIGLMGHSQGGMYIFKADSVRDDVSFIIDFSGSPGTPLKQSHYNIRSKIIDNGGSEDYAEALAALMDDYIVYLRKRENYEALRTTHDTLIAHSQRPIADKIKYFEQFEYLMPPQQLPSYHEMRMYPFMRSYDYQSADFVPTLSIPGLFIYGKKDKVIPSWTCIAMVEELQQKNSNITLKVFDKAGHNMKESGLTGQKFPEGYLDYLVTWVHDKTGNN